MGNTFMGTVLVETSGQKPVATITLDGDAGGVSAGGSVNATLSLENNSGNEIVRLGKPASNILGPINPLAPNAADGGLALNNASGDTTINLDGGTGIITAGGTNAQLGLFPKAAGVTTDLSKATVHLRASDGIVRVGDAGADGRFFAYDKDGKARITLGLTPDSKVSELVMEGATGSLLKTAQLVMGGNGANGLIYLMDLAGNASIKCDSTNGDIWVKGDVTLAGADCAEQFEIAEAEAAEPGTVMVIDDGGRLRQSRQAYDKKVAGVISGAGVHKPGIVLDKQSGDNRMAVALVGKVFCKVDARYSAVEVGDLLTTSDTPGYAMKAEDPVKAFGTVIGKALRCLSSGQGLIPVLVALQ